ncbi:uncharacterized protein LOC123722891 [Papilio machaon]|uniref:uncharacterized protein LOC123722891 n=1 Tax=Papilio machaon TaxID=76193 RepID=UPI001E66472E|nr:uncharacterized protein LOC123722891 [Papilio machaon]
MYSKYRIKELKDELRKRGASLRGKKADLVERLEFYDQNFNFGRSENTDKDDPKMQLPLGETYRDINSNTILPPLDKTMIRHYLCYTQKKIDTAMQLYETRHLLMARASVVGDNTFIKGYCRKTMKSLQYEVDILINKNGNPEASQCECPAGSGTNALCKHVAVLLFGIENMVREKLLLLQEVCTQKLQQFHVPSKPYTGSPVKAEKFYRRKRNIIFEPYSLKNIDRVNYNTRFSNLILGFWNSRMPLKQLYEPANPYALINDHTYTNMNPEEQFLKEMKLNKITNEEADLIQNNTIGQSECPDWHKYRQVRLTASNFHTICNLKPKTMAKYARKVINKKEFKSRATSHGLLNEKIALRKYAVEYDLLIKPCGIFISLERPYLAASPDGLLSTETIIEIKCPYASRYQTIDPTSTPYLELINGILTLKKTSPYYYQVQGQLYCSGRSYCNVVIYTYKDLKVVYVEKDNYFISSMLAKLDCFYITTTSNAPCSKIMFTHLQQCGSLNHLTVTHRTSICT